MCQVSPPASVSECPNVGVNVGICHAGEGTRVGECGQVQENRLEAATGVEPVIKVLQTSALPLGYAAPALLALRAAGRPVAAGLPLPPARREADTGADAP